MKLTTTQMLLLMGTVSVIALSPQDSYARRSLVPDQPSVEVRLEALRALRRSANMERSRTYALPTQSNIPFGAPTPPPARPIYAQPAPVVTKAPVAPQAVPQRVAPQPVVQAAKKPKPVVAKPNVIKAVPKVAVAKPKPKAPVAQMPVIEVPVVKEPVIIEKPKLQVAEPKPTFPAISPRLELPKVVEPKEPLPKKVDDALSLELPEITKTTDAKKTVDALPPSFSEFPPLEELPVEVVEIEQPEEEIQELSLEDLMKDMPEIEEPELPDMVPVSPAKLPEVETKAAELSVPSPTSMLQMDKLPEDIEVNTLEMEVPAIETTAEGEPSQEDMDDLMAGLNKLEGLQDSLEEEIQELEAAAKENAPKIPDLMPQLSDDAPEVQVKISETPSQASTAKQQDGFLPNLSQSFRSFLGGKEDKTAKVVEPASAPALNTTQPPAKAVVDQDVGLPALPVFDNNASTAQEDPSLPALPSFENEAASNADIFGDASSSELPGLPPLPGAPQTEVEKAQDTIDSMLPDSEAIELASLPDTNDELETLPPLKELEIGAPSGNASLSVVFSQSETEVPLSFQQPLINLSKELIANADSKIKVVAYASASEDQSSIARRISLARALAVRAFLIDLGVDNVRISVQALGNEVSSGPTERADIILN